MFLSKTVSVVSFFGALVIGISAAWVGAVLTVPASVEPFAGPVLPAPDVYSSGAMHGSCHRRMWLVPVRAEDLRGRWSGIWGYDNVRSTIEIDRVEGNKFYGTLRELGAEIALEGTLNGRQITFRETKVIKLGPEMSEWSLGSDVGSFSPDGRNLTGFGNDKWGRYGWEMDKLDR